MGTNRLELTPPLLILTMGYPGSGKSFFARQFSEQYKLACLSEDRLRYELFEKPLFNRDEQDIISRVYEYGLEQLMSTGVSVVCDGSFSNAKERKRLGEFAHKNGYKTLLVWLQTDINTSYTRASRRDRRNIDSKYAFALERNIFERLAGAVEKPAEKEQSVVISGKHAFRGQSLTVLRKITELYAANISSIPRAQPSATPQRQNSRQLIQ